VEAFGRRVQSGKRSGPAPQLEEWLRGVDNPLRSRGDPGVHVSGFLGKGALIVFISVDWRGFAELWVESGMRV
jgi:hypothetical protein